MLELSASPRINAYNVDCMEFMKHKPYNYYDLAIVDPPYGIGGGSSVTGMNKMWDSSIPKESYFIELVRTSVNQIIWGGNYMSCKIPFYSKHTIIWDKENGDSFMSDGEIAFTSFNRQTTKFFRLFWMSNMMKREEKPLIHPTQKPVALYRWILKNYAKQGDKILDTHGGSFSSAIACHMEGFDLDICELDPDYFNDAVKRFNLNTCQKELDFA